MKLEVFSVRDMKAEAFLQPFFVQTVGAALRAFGDAVDKEDSPFHKHPEDYVLYQIGEYNDADGSLVSISPVKMLACASDFVLAKGVPPARSGSANLGVAGATRSAPGPEALPSENGVKVEC